MRLLYGTKNPGKLKGFEHAHESPGHASRNLLCQARQVAKMEMAAMPNRDRLNRTFRDRWDHTKRVLAWAKRLHDKEGGDWDVIELATWLHDCGFEEGRPHAAVSADKARVFFEAHAYEKAELVIYMIENHSRKEDAALTLPLELKILMDADTLDEKGALAIILDAISEGMENPQVRYEDVYGRILRYFPQVRREERHIKTESGLLAFQRKIRWMEGCMKAMKEELGE